MLRLALLRHAKSSWDHSGLDDFDRPLNERGNSAAPIMGQLLASMKFTPQTILCSPSKRTRETLDRIQPFFAAPPASTDFDKGLYLAGASDLWARIRRSPKPATHILVIGHNPGLHTLATHLASTGEAGAIARLHDKLPTAGLALYSFDATDWAALNVQTGNLDAFISPKDRA